MDAFDQQVVRLEPKDTDAQLYTRMHFESGIR